MLTPNKLISFQEFRNLQAFESLNALIDEVTSIKLYSIKDARLADEFFEKEVRLWDILFIKEIENACTPRT